MTDFMLADVARHKAELLKVPVVAHSKAFMFYQQAQDRNDKDAIEVWAQVLRELGAEGYAPDPAGNPGPAVKSHYDAGVLGTGSSPVQRPVATEITSRVEG